jgi:hypothetical protein
MKIDEYIQNNKSVSSTECAIYQTDISTCPKKVLGLSFGMDRTQGKFLNRIEKSQSEQKNSIA